MFDQKKGDKENRSTSYLDGKIRDMFGFSVFSKGVNGLLKEINEVGYQSGTKWIATVNSEFVVLAQESDNFKKILNKTWLNVPDGVGVTWAMEMVERKKSNIFEGLKIGLEILRGKNREALIPGVDLIDRLCRLAESDKKSVYFFGGWDNRAEKTADFFKSKYPNLRVAGFSAEEFDFSKNIDFLFVARGMRTQEEWIDKNLSKLKAEVVMGVGRSFDYFSGELKRAPEWVRKRGLEWLYSLWKQPERWRRQLRLPKFIWFVLKNLPKT
jgi:N-acetylglucosaminyldiphosphoundecaprenol N-acetyl-beta-D-mannosaminyltransferase